MAEDFGELGKMYVKIQADVNDLKKDINSVKQNLNKEADNIQKNVGGKLSSTFKAVGSSIAAAFGTAAIVKFGFEAVTLAGKVQGVKRAFDNLNQPGLLNRLREAVKGTVSDFELMQVAMRASNFKIPLTELSTLLEFAKKRATQTGQSVDYLVNSIIDGIGRKSTLVLDNLGISATELQEEFKKTGDFGKATANIIEREMKKMGDVVETAADKTARLNAEIENQKVKIGNDLLPYWNATLFLFGKVIGAIDLIRGGLAQMTGNNLLLQEKLLEMAERHQQYGKLLVSTYKESQKISSFIVSTYKQQLDTIGQVKAKIDALVEQQENLVYGSKEYLEIQKEIDRLEKSIGLGKDTKRTITGEIAGDFNTRSVRNMFPNGIDIEARGMMVGVGNMEKTPQLEFDVLAPTFEDQLREALQSQSDKFVNDMGEIVGLATDFGNKLGIAADTFAGKLISAVDTVLSMLQLINSTIQIFGGGGILSLFGGHHGGNFIGTSNGVRKMAGGGSFIVPPGYPNDSYPLLVESGERVSVNSAYNTGMESRLLRQIDKKLAILNHNTVEGQLSKSNSKQSAIPITGEIGMNAIYLTNKKASKYRSRMG